MAIYHIFEGAFCNKREEVLDLFRNLKVWKKGDRWASHVSMDTQNASREADISSPRKSLMNLHTNMVIDAEMHSDEEAELLACGSRQENLWGINLYPGLSSEDWLEYDSMINLRPSFGNMSRGVDDPAIREDIRSLVLELVER